MFVGTHLTWEWTMPLLSFYSWWECLISLFPGRRKDTSLVKNCRLFCAWNLSCLTNFPCLMSTNRILLVPHLVSHFHAAAQTLLLPILLLEIVNGLEAGKEHGMTFFMAVLCLPTLALWWTDWALPTCSTDWVWAGAWRHSSAWTPKTKPWFWQPGGWDWHHMNEWNRGTHVKPCMLSSGWGYPGERCNKGTCLKQLAIQTPSFDVHKILPSHLKVFRWISSPGHGSSSVQDPSNIRKYTIYPAK